MFISHIAPRLYPETVCMQSPSPRLLPLVATNLVSLSMSLLACFCSMVGLQHCFLLLCNLAFQYFDPLQNNHRNNPAVIFIIEMYYVTIDCISHTPFIPVTFILQLKVCSLIPLSLLSPSLTLLLFVDYLFVLYESVSVHLLCLLFFVYK